MTESTRMPKMTEDEFTSFANEVFGGEIFDLDYEDLVRAISKANYVLDLCMAELDSRGELTYLDGETLIVPDARPESLDFDTPLSGGSMPVQ